VQYQQAYETQNQQVNGKKKDSTLSILAAVCALFTITGPIGCILGIIDLIAFGRDGKRHLGSWFAIIYVAGIALVLYLLRR
jgi:small neutral amino acid transporter SnatA (MarC family)